MTGLCLRKTAQALPHALELPPKSNTFQDVQISPSWTYFYHSTVSGAQVLALTGTSFSFPVIVGRVLFYFSFRNAA